MWSSLTISSDASFLGLNVLLSVIMNADLYTISNTPYLLVGIAVYSAPVMSVFTAIVSIFILVNARRRTKKYVSIAAALISICVLWQILVYLVISSIT